MEGFVERLSLLFRMGIKWILLFSYYKIIYIVE